MDDIQSNINKWKKVYTTITEFDKKTSVQYTNVISTSNNIKDLATTIKSNIPTFKTIINQYLLDNRKEIWLRYWIQETSTLLIHKLNGYRYHISYIVDPLFEKEWSTVENMVFPDTYNTLYRNAVAIIDTVKSKKSLLDCDDQSILALHEGKECQRNSWGCGICERMSYNWNQKLIKEALNTNNIFLNTKLQEEFIQYAKNIITIPDSWEPAKKHTCSIQKTYKNNATTIQNLRELIGSMYNWGLSHRLKTDSEYSTFISMWSYMDEITPVLDNDSEMLALIFSQ